MSPPSPWGNHQGNEMGGDKANNYPLPNLFVTVLQHFGIEADKFASSAGTMHGMETARKSF